MRDGHGVDDEVEAFGGSRYRVGGRDVDEFVSAALARKRLLVCGAANRGHLAPERLGQLDCHHAEPADADDADGGALGDLRVLQRRVSSHTRAHDRTSVLERVALRDFDSVTLVDGHAGAEASHRVALIRRHRR
eukprot:5307656-Pleurochrysis_carterae.AAC.2